MAQGVQLLRLDLVWEELRLDMNSSDFKYFIAHLRTCMASVAGDVLGTSGIPPDK